jgi:cellulose synthase/poly-beta-1,6-N-acetylglucosamine synthase-like glycosyltransferase/spore germination protein YaaH/peptidoglycan/xylan/chitin deacetylase (PgdA/CDA1 family)
MSDRAIFFDPTRRRWSWVKRLGTLAGLVAAVTMSVWLVSLFASPILPGFEGITKPIVRKMQPMLHLPHRQQKMTQFLAERSRKKLFAAIAQDFKQKQAVAAQPLVRSENIVAAFYAPWEETGLHALAANAKNMTHVLPVWFHLAPDGAHLDRHDFDVTLVPHNADVMKTARENNLNIVPVFSNAQLSTSGSGEFDPKRVHEFLTNPVAQQRLIFELRSTLQQYHFQGVNVDFENLDPQDDRLYVPFLQRLKTSFAPAHLSVSADLEVNDRAAALDWRAVSSICDFVIVMAYNENGETTKMPGPIASMNWYRRQVQRAVEVIPHDKLVIGLANFALDWADDRDYADPMSYQGALVTAGTYRVNEKPENIVDFDDVEMNPTFWYVDDEHKQHEVWMLDAVTAANQWLVAQNYGVRGIGVWVLGSTDPSIWSFIRRDALTRAPNFNDLKNVTFPYDVEFVGEGDVAHVQAQPKPGERALEIDPTTGLAIDESYKSFPASYVIGRTGYRDKMIALTIDDGPSRPYTGEILDELKELHVPATFFLIGENAERYPSLVRRIWREGHEIGNHSFTHSDLGAVNPQQARLELNATQRVFQSILNRSTLLFRPPYNADAEPTAEREVKPIEIATELNYITVLEYLDPQDWDLVDRAEDGTPHVRKAEEMFRTLMDQLETEHGSTILLHDGGGNREETVRLIPMIVKALRAKGYTFVPVSTLINSTRETINPPVSSRETMMLANDRFVFEAIYLFELFLGIAFITGIILGTARVVFVTVLAIMAKMRERRQVFDESYRPAVSVVIAAYNEQPVIARTIRAVLRNHYEPLDIIVVDDGSSDDTYDEIMRHFGGHPSLRVMRQENAGKAAALNQGIAEATGEIIIALDADTVFAKDTIERLVRHFADPHVGAVAGNVKVGNRINPLTYWQSIEYVTSQNLDRRAYAAINSVSVVPGAVGAWRREAIVQADGYSTDTMAEDMDLTWRIRRIGWRIENEAAAIGYTEVPDTFMTLYKQRFRWAFGTLQSLWKHRRAIGRYGWFGRVMLPSLWLFQIFFQAISPLVDLQIVWAIGKVIVVLATFGFNRDWQPLPNAVASLYLVAFMYAFFFVVELIGALVAFKLDREKPKVLLWLFWQRFLYRQLMYAVLLKSLKTALSGIRAGWGKLERKGTVAATEAAPDAPPDVMLPDSLTP